MTGDKLPDRLCSSKTSPFFDARFMSIGVRFNGEDQTRVIEFHVKGGWIRRYKVDANGKPIKNMLNTAYAVEKKTGVVEPYWKNK